MPGLGTSLGRGGATMPYWELARSDLVVIMGSNMAEAHPVAFRYALQAKERGARVVHVDPRFTRTSALATDHVALRPGSDLAFLGGLIRHVLEERREFRDYVARYTNASFLVGEAFRDDVDEGVFSGLDEEKAEPTYDAKSWDYERDEHGAPKRDPSLEHPRSVFQILRRHFARYTPGKVTETCGVPEARFRELAEIVCAASGRERTAAWVYAVGWTQHTTGVQNIRACAILQLLLGNMGRPGGGILALRGHTNIQGATDLATLYNNLPGYLPIMRERAAHATLASYLACERRYGAWSRLDAYVVSQLKAFFGDAARPENDFGYGLLPKIPDVHHAGDESFQVIFEEMLKGQVKGLLCLGQNPAAGGPNAKLTREALAKLEWLVVRDFFEQETAAFWKAPGIDPAAIDTEVFFLPASTSFEKSGSVTNTMRLVQWHERAVEPPGEARSELWFANELVARMKLAYAGSREAKDEPVRALAWSYAVDALGEPDPGAFLREVNGMKHGGAHVADALELASDGSTSCGSWIHAGVFPAPGANLARRREPGGPVHAAWGFAWPGNRRVLYNRASADPDGKPWSEAKKLVWWDAGQGKWVGDDAPDFELAKAPGYRPGRPEGGGAFGTEHQPGDAPFGLVDGGLARLYVNAGLADGPLPTHFEPVESPLPHNPLHRRRSNPPAKHFAHGEPLAPPGDPRWPCALTTYRLTEHYLTGVMSRWLPWLAELQPKPFAEIPEGVAREKGIVSGDKVRVTTPRGSLELTAVVTRRLRTLDVAGRKVPVIGVPWHYGYQGLVRGMPANDLTAMVGDPNVSIQEAKALVCDVEKA